MKLTDTQTAILAAAAKHPEGLILPPPTPPAPRAQIARKFSILGVAEPVDLDADQPPAMAWRTEQDGRRIGLRITGTGRSAIGAAPAAEPDIEIEAAFDPLTGTAGAAPAAEPDEQQPQQEQQAEATAPKPGEKRAAEREAKRAARGADYARRVAESEAEAAAAAPRKRASSKAAEEAADRGELPTPPDFTAETHKPYRAKRQKLIDLAEAGDIEGLRAVAINPTSTSPKALIRYRDLAIRALEARAAR